MASRDNLLSSHVHRVETCIAGSRAFTLSWSPLLGPSRFRIVRPCAAARMSTHSRRDPGEMASPARQAEKERGVMVVCTKSKDNTCRDSHGPYHNSSANGPPRRPLITGQVARGHDMATHWRDKEQCMLRFCRPCHHHLSSLLPSSIMGRHAALDLLLLIGTERWYIARMPTCSGVGDGGATTGRPRPLDWA
ncbi:uncharacterized protein LY79DRAFT_539732 [Colletotrichum navitas]|uniref:Uncharacterized protein n=1 Tax=Colletotrichum navitas TaxID=681940 RepID=A0AAD8Q8X9_9PEZI|nr:uncharacterized protein LY79DRAFT_539732 [Colletotrichum navitas]KAK1597970.1 hypothetical protein LY79DRAFT_539732 [Colletotrichum navitas]